MENNKRIMYFILSFPFIDVITALITRNLNLGITPGIIIKSIFLLFLSIYIIYTKSKYKKLSIIMLTTILLYFIGYFAFKPEILEEQFIFKELQYLFRLIYFPITFLGLLCYFDENNFNKDLIKNMLFKSLIIYFFLLIIPLITGTAYNTYPVDWKGYVGWFYAGNEVANIMILLLPAAYFIIDRNDYSFLILFPIYLIALSIGTKVATFGSLIVAIITLIYYLLKKNFKKIIYALLTLIVVSLMIPKSYAVYNYKFSYSEVEPLIIEENNIEEINKINNNINKFYNKNKATKVLKNLLNGRDMLLANTLSIYNDNKNDSNIWFGIGFSNTKTINNNNVARLIEIDILDGNFHYGLMGLIIMLSPLLISTYLIIISRRKVTIDALYFILIILLLCGISTFSGHVLASPAVSIYLVLYLLLLLNEFYIFKHNDKIQKKISILALHMGHGGIEKSICNQANMLSKEYEVEIASLYKLSDNIPYELNKQVKLMYLSNLKPNRKEFKLALKSKNPFKIIKEGVKAIYILYQKKSLIIKYIYNSNSRIIISTRIDFTKHLNNYGDNNTIKIAEEHVYHNNSQKYINKLKRNLTNIDYLIPSSKYLTNDYKNFYKNERVKIIYIPQIIDFIPENTNSCNNYNIISVGRLSKEKGFEDLIKIMKLINDKNKSIKLTLVGDGPERENLEKLIKEYNLKNIKLKGFLDAKQLRKEYQKASLYIMTSFEESFGLVLIEALAYGIPCFAFDSALGAKEIINKSNGKLIHNRDIDLMASEVLNYFKEDNHQEMINSAKKTALNYRYDKVQSEWLKFINNIVED